MVHGDDKGLILPPLIAPIQIIIIPIYKNNNEKIVKDSAKLVKDSLLKSGYRVFVDERNEYTAGWKYNEWEVKGIPIRISIGQRDIENKTIEIVRRDNKQKQVIPLEQLNESIEKIFYGIQNDLLNVAGKYLKEKTKKVLNYEEFVKVMGDSEGFILSGWCGDEECELKIKEETGADIRVIPFNQEELNKDIKNCIYCNKPFEKTVVFARAY
jgi:prolyl-tRNA synthetase